MLRALIALLVALAVPAAAQAPAEVLRRYKADEATQGVAVDATHFYAVANSQIGKYHRATGRRVALWTGDPARYPHLNSCNVIGRELVCASSNYPATPMTSSVEVFDPVRMVHLRSIPLGRQIGSLTWVDRQGGAWWAGFANYDGRGGEPGRDHRASAVVKFDDRWRKQGQWTFPPTVLARFKPYSTSGGVWGPGGRLYVTGHDLGEVYELQRPVGGTVLRHVVTWPAPIEGQAIAMDKRDGRVIFGINRPTREVVQMRLPRAETK